MIDIHSGTRVASVTLEILGGCPLHAALRNSIQTAFENGCNVTFVHNAKTYLVDAEDIIAYVAKKG